MALCMKAVAPKARHSIISRPGITARRILPMWRPFRLLRTATSERRGLGGRIWRRAGRHRVNRALKLRLRTVDGNAALALRRIARQAVADSVTVPDAAHLRTQTARRPEC